MLKAKSLKEECLTGKSLKQNRLKSKSCLRLLAVEILVILLLFPGCFQKDREILNLTPEGTLQGTVAKEEGVVFQSERFELTPGVYRIYVETELSKGQEAEIGMFCEEAPFHALRTNAVTLNEKKQSAGIEVYVSGKVPEVYVSCILSGASEGVVQKLTVCRTAMGNQELLLGVIYLITGVNLLLYFGMLIKNGRIDKRQQTVVWGIGAACVMAVFPFLTDYLIVGEETLRLCQWLAGYRMGLPVMTVYKLFMIDITMATAISAYFGLHRWFPKGYTALAGTIIYLLNPWRLIHVYHQAAVWKCLVWLLLPFAGMLLHAVVKKHKRRDNREQGSKTEAERIVWIVAVIVTVFAVRQLNRIAFESSPVRLYAEDAISSVAWEYAVTGLGQIGIKGWFHFRTVAVELGTLLTGLLFFREHFHKEASRIPAVCGGLLYYTCPYRLYVSFTLADVSQAAAWMLLPVYGIFVGRIICSKKDRKKLFLNSIAGGMILAAMGYVYPVFCLTVLGLTLLAGLMWKRFAVWMPALTGSILGCMPLLEIVRYLFTGSGKYADLSLNVIMEKGYRLGEFFTAYVYKDGHPGLGIGILFCLILGLWLHLVKGAGRWDKASRVMAVLAGLLAVLSLRYFPWDLVQRLGGWAMRLVALIGTPAFFGGLASACLCVPGAEAVRDWMKMMQMGKNCE